MSSTGGIMLFSKEFIRAIAKVRGWARRTRILASVAAQPRLMGGLVTAMLGLAVEKSGLPVSYIELANGALTDAGARANRSNWVAVRSGLLHLHQGGLERHMRFVL